METLEFSRVRENHPLPGFFEGYLGAKKTVVSGGVRYSACPSCGASEHADSVKVSVRGYKWHCFSCQKKGDVIDAAMMFWDKPSLHEAALELNGGTLPSYRPSKSRPVVAEPAVRDQGAINEMIDRLLEANQSVSSGVLEYLQSRAIALDVVDQARQQNLLIGLSADPDECLRFLLDVLGRDLMVAAGVWKIDSRAPGIIYRPLIFVSDDRTGAEFRRINETGKSSAKAIRYGNPTPFFWKGSRHTMVVEGAIDLLSAVMLGSERSIIGLPGASNWHVDDQWVQNLGADGHVLFALDNDKSGIEQSRLLAAHMLGFENFDPKNAETNDRLSNLLSVPQRRFRLHSLPEGMKDLNVMLNFISDNKNP